MAKTDVKTDKTGQVQDETNKPTVVFEDATLDQDTGQDVIQSPGMAAPTPPAQLESGGEPVTNLPNETQADVARDSLGRRKRQPRTGPAAKRKAYAVFDPTQVKDGGEVRVVLATFKADEVLAHMDEHKDHRYVSFMI